MYIKKLSYPAIPEELLSSIDDILEIEGQLQQPHYTRVPIKNNLIEWLELNLPFAFDAHYQVIRNTIPIHRDKRMIAVNYLLDTGGTNVVTTMYADDKITVLADEVFPIHEWRCLFTFNYHGVSGVDFSRPRIALSVMPLDPEKYISESFNI